MPLDDKRSGEQSRMAYYQKVARTNEIVRLVFITYRTSLQQYKPVICTFLSRFGINFCIVVKEISPRERVGSGDKTKAKCGIARINETMYCTAMV